MIEIDASSAITPEMKKAFEGEILKQTGLGERLAPKVIRISAPHAEYVEFGTSRGTNPSRATKSVAVAHKDRKGNVTNMMMEMTPFQEKLYDWARTLIRSGKMDADVATDMEAWGFARYLSVKIFQNGVAPQPFIRQVLYNDNVFGEAMAKFKDGGSLQDVANLYAEKIRDNALILNIGQKIGSIADEIHISDSISVKDYSPDMDDGTSIKLDRTKYEEDYRSRNQRF